MEAGYCEYCGHKKDHDPAVHPYRSPGGLKDLYLCGSCFDYLAKVATFKCGKCGADYQTTGYHHAAHGVCQACDAAEEARALAQKEINKVYEQNELFRDLAIGAALLALGSLVGLLTRH